MVKFSDNCNEIEIDGKKYIACDFKYKEYELPVVIDYDIHKKLKYNDASWFINDKGYVVTKYKKKNNSYCDIYLHDIIMQLKYKNVERKSILHINKIHIDNRLENLMYDVKNKDITKNIVKKKRIIEFSNDCDIVPEELPSFVWYMKENGTHGERFIVKVGKKCWKSTASKKISLRYKFEETKKYLRYMKKTNPMLFDKYSMNGDLNSEGRILFESFYKIAQEAGYTNLVNLYADNKTDKYLKEDLTNLTDAELIMLKKRFNE